MEVNKTLLMGKTDFEMRGNLTQKEPKFLEQWYNDDLYHLLIKKHEKDPCFMLHDGPPYANGDMHCGHMLNRILKDIVIRYKSMNGYYTPFIPGWDTHGLPIEVMVTKSGVNRKTTPILDFRKKCNEYAHKQVDRQMNQIKRLGIMADFENRYLTLDKRFEKEQIHVFKKMALKGLIFKGLKPVYWSPSSESALAEAEIEYQNVKATTIYVSFRVTDGKGILTSDDSLVIWTTTPWTIPADLAICLNPELEYGLFETNRGNLVFLTSLEDSLKEELHLEKVTLLKTFLGKELEYVKVKHPLYDRESVVILGDHVTSDAGTGCVHTAPGHGEDDYKVGRKYKLEPYCPVDEHGNMDETTGDRLKGLFYEKANDEVIKMLEEANVLLAKNTIEHSYPHDWRTKKPVIFRATPQWFCSIDSIRDDLLKEIDKVNWIPKWGCIRMHNMIKDREDWCISRQRVWGVPLPIIYDKDGNALMEKEVFDHIEELIGEYGSDIWFAKDVDFLLPEGYIEKHQDKAPFKKEKDIMDVWFDSGSSFRGVMIGRDLKFPADLYLEGNDQYRGWFNASLIVSVASEKVAPFKTVVTHGMVLDGNGNKMSKSLGNGVDPNKVINVYGADVLRLYTATVDYQADVRISDSILKTCADTYRKIRNTFKFMLANLSDSNSYFDYEKDAVKEFSTYSLYILERLKEVKNKALDNYENYNFANMIQEILTFLTQDVSAFYISIAKDSLYCDEENAHRRKEFQTVLFKITREISLLLAPTLCFTMEEVQKYLPYSKKEKYIALEDMVKKEEVNESLLKEYEEFMEVRADVMKALEDARSENILGSSLEASLTLKVKDEMAKKVLSRFNKEELNLLFIVSSTNMGEASKEYNHLYIDVKRHNGQKCERCWQYFDSLEEFEGNHICHRCHEELKHHE